MPKASAVSHYPPGDHPVGHLVGRYGLLPLMRTLWKVGRIELAPTDAARLLEATSTASLVCPNHPTLQEPVVVFGAMQRLRLKANYAVALDTMRILHRVAPLMQGFGCYSIRRGAPDRPAIAVTRELLCEGRRVVMFPEGETSGLNDALLPLRDGVAQLGYWAVAERIKRGLPPTVRLVPVAVKYLYSGDMTPVIDASLARLEAEIGIARDATPRYERLRRIGHETARAIEAEYGLELPDDSPLDQHIETVLAGILTSLQHACDLKPDADETPNASIRRIFAVIGRELHERREPETAYARRLREERRPGWQALDRQAARLQTFQAVRDGYVAAYPSAERYLDVLGRLERDYFGRERKFALRRAVVTVGEPFDLAETYADYQADRRGAVEAATAELGRRLQALVDANTRLAQPLSG